MLIELKGFVFCRTSGGKPEFEMLPWDCRIWDAVSVDGRVFVKEHTITVEVPDDFRPASAASCSAGSRKAKGPR